VRPLQACGGSLCVGQEGEAAARRRAGQDDVAGAQALDSQEFAGRRVVVVLLDGGEIQPARVEPGGGGASGGRRPRREEDDLRLAKWSEVSAARHARQTARKRTAAAAGTRVRIWSTITSSGRTGWSRRGRLGGASWAWRRRRIVSLFWYQELVDTWIVGTYLHGGRNGLDRRLSSAVGIRGIWTLTMQTAYDPNEAWRIGSAPTEAHQGRHTIRSDLASCSLQPNPVSRQPSGPPVDARARTIASPPFSAKIYSIPLPAPICHLSEPRQTDQKTTFLSHTPYVKYNLKS
jgi:hypothetical protein